MNATSTSPPLRPHNLTQPTASREGPEAILKKIITLLTSIPAIAFLSLPYEIILEIVEYLDNPKQIISVTRVNRRLYNILRDCPLRYNIQFQGSSALIWAARNGRLEIVRDLLPLRPDANTKAGSELDETALHIAAKNGFFTMAKLLLEAGADPEVIGFQGQKPLFIALASGYEEIAGMIFCKMNSQITPIADSNLDDTPLHGACRYKRPKATRYFLEAGAYVDAKDAKGSTPLQHVVESNSIGNSGSVLCDDILEIVLALLEFGATPDPESLQSLQSLRHMCPDHRAFGMHVGRAWMATNSEICGSVSRPYVNEICLHLNLLEGKFGQVELKPMFKY
jgi:ankyrin repeat protein